MSQIYAIGLPSKAPWASSREDVPDRSPQIPVDRDGAPMNVRSEILQFLRAPQEFASTLPRDDDPIWRQGLEEFAHPQIAD